MNAPVTRRALLGATAAGVALGVAGVGIPASALASPASDRDAGLFDLIACHGEARASMHQASAASDAAFAAFLSTVPPRPDALRWQEDDFPRQGFGPYLCDRDSDGAPREYGARAVKWLRGHEAFPGWAVRVGARMSPDDAAACERRRLEIVEAWDAHQAARRDVDVVTGYAAACKASDSAADLVLTLAAEVARARPQTLPGLRALAAWFAGQVEADEVHDDFLDLFAGTVAAFGEVTA